MTPSGPQCTSKTLSCLIEYVSKRHELHGDLGLLLLVRLSCWCGFPHQSPSRNVNVTGTTSSISWFGHFWPSLKLTPSYSRTFPFIISSVPLYVVFALPFHYLERTLYVVFALPLYAPMTSYFTISAPQRHQKLQLFLVSHYHPHHTRKK